MSKQFDADTIKKISELIGLDVCCECGELYSVETKDYVYLYPKINHYHYLVVWTCRECDSEQSDEGQWMYEWL
jgi:hypothetical protein